MVKRSLNAGLALFLFFIIGLLLIRVGVWIEHASHDTLLRLFGFVVRDVGIAFLVSVVIGGSFEYVARNRLLEDTLNVALGYILPDELKGEVRALYEETFVCVDHDQICTLKSTEDPDIVILHSSVRRTMVNVTNTKRNFLVRLVLTELFLPFPSSIISIGYIQNGREVTMPPKVELEKGINKIAGDLPEASVAPREKIIVWYEYEESKHMTDSAIYSWRNTTVNPQVTVTTVATGGKPPPPVTVNIRFNSRHYGEVDHLGRDTQRLRGVLTPFQYIELRWFQNQQYNKWISQVTGLPLPEALQGPKQEVPKEKRPDDHSYSEAQVNPTAPKQGSM